LVAVTSDPVDLVLKTCPLSDSAESKVYPGCWHGIEQFTTLYKGAVIHDMEVLSAGIVLYTSTDMVYSVVLITDDSQLQSIEFPPHVSQVLTGDNSGYNQSQLNLVIKSYVKASREFSVSFSNFRLNWRRLLDNGKYNMRRFTTFGDVPYTVISASTLQPASYTLFQCYMAVTDR